MVTRYGLSLAPICIFLTVMSPVCDASTHGRRITCACTTLECKSHRNETCVTSSVCFTQYLEREDGRDPLLRGCIDSRTPLLCLNRRPAVASRSSWPILICCNRSMCNSQLTFSLPLVTVKSDSNGTDTGRETTVSYTTLEDYAVGHAQRGRFTVLMLSVAILVSVVIGGVVVLVALRRRHSRHSCGAVRIRSDNSS